MKNETIKEIETTFGAKDAELCGFTYTIPEDMEAEIKDGKVIVKRKESKNETVRKAIVKCVTDYGPSVINPELYKDMLDYLEERKHNWSPTEGEMSTLYKLCYLSSNIEDKDDTELTRLYQDLKREYFRGHSFENMKFEENSNPEKCWRYYTWHPRMKFNYDALVHYGVAELGYEIVRAGNRPRYHYNGYYIFLKDIA